MMLRAVTLLVAAVLLCGTLQASTAKLEKCIGSIEQRISVADFKKCEALTVSKKITPRQKAQIMLQLGITVQVEQLTGRKKVFPDDPLLPIDYWKKAIAADQTFADPYLTLATEFDLQQQVESKRQFLEAGRNAAPDDPRFDSEIALMDATPESAAVVRDLCNRATAHHAADQSVFYNCGEAFWRSNLKIEAEVSFRKAAFDFPVEKLSRYGLVQSSIRGDTFAVHLQNDGKFVEAAIFFEKYLSLKPKYNVSDIDLELLGGFYVKAEMPSEAAAVFEKAARQTSGDVQYKFRLRQIVSLATAGNHNEAVLVSTGIYESASKKQILQLQLKLKNGGQKQLKITGKFDLETKSALKNCIADRGCFTAKAGQLL